MQTTVPSYSGERAIAFAQTVPGKVIVSIAATLAIAMAAHIAVPLPFTPVPLTMQPLAVLCVGLALGPTAGFFTLIAYLAEGAAGLPVFSPTGLGGLAQLFGPTGGFLMAYPLVAAIAGALTQGLGRLVRNQFLAAFFGCTVAMSLLFASGAGWFLHFTGLSLHATWTAAVFPFLPGELIKALVAAGLYSTFKRPARI